MIFIFAHLLNYRVNRADRSGNRLCSNLRRSTEMSGNRQIVCPHCGGINRVPDDRPAEAAKCGKCKSPLFAGKPADVDAAMFEKQTQ